MDLLTAISKFATLATELIAADEATKVAAEIVQKEAKSELGHYQSEIGPVDAWAPLAESTKADRVAHGYPEDEPLLRDGTLRDSIEVVRTKNGHAVGSELEKAFYLEVGTATIPPRSFLEGSFYRKEKEIKEKVGDKIVAKIVK